MTSNSLPPTSKRVQQATSPEVNARIQSRTEAEVSRLETASTTELTRRIEELDSEWDIERTLQMNASMLALSGSLLGYSTGDRRYFLVPTLIFGFFLQHSLQGWCPPIPVFRRLGVRTQPEIERERYALKALRGDFDALSADGTHDDASGRVRAALAAVDI